MTRARAGETSPRAHRRYHLSPTGRTEEATAAGIYGVIISGAVMAASHAETAVAVIVAVLVTLSIYWSAERFSRLVAGRVHHGRRPTGRELRRQLTSGWEIVTASALPLVVLVVLRAVFDLSLSSAILGALATSTLLLGLAGWDMGRDGQLTTAERCVAATAAGLMGVVLIVLKALLH